MEARPFGVRSTCMALLFALAVLCSGVLAKNPETRSFFKPNTGSLTPPPKEWAMFPQDEPSPAQGAQQANQTSANNASGSVSGDRMGGIVPASNLHARQHELPLFWLLVTGLLSIGAMAACGSLIMRKDSPSPAAKDTVPTVGEEQEVGA